MFGTYARNVIAGQGRYVPDTKSEIPSVSLKDCYYYKDRKVLMIASEPFGGGFPREFYVVSHKTGKEFRFTPVGPEDILFDQDHWDGEQQIYRPVGHCPNVDYMVVHHAW